MGGRRLGSVKFSFTKNPESDFFIKNLKLTTFLAVGRGGGGVVARVSDFFSFCKRIQV